MAARAGPDDAAQSAGGLEESLVNNNPLSDEAGQGKAGRETLSVFGDNAVGAAAQARRLMDASTHAVGASTQAMKQMKAMMKRIDPATFKSTHTVDV